MRGMFRFLLGAFTYLVFFGSALLLLPAFLATALVHRADAGCRMRGRMLRRFGRLISAVTPFWRFSVRGDGPADIRQRPYVVVANHESIADPFLISLLPWDMRWVAKQELFRMPLVGWLMRLGGDIPLRRGERDSVVQMLAECRRTLASGVPVMLFPEGTRSPDGRLLPFKDGAFQLAIEAGVPVLPLAIAGTRQCRAKGSLGFEFARAQVRVLEPIDTSGMTPDDLPRLREEARERIACASKALRAELGVPEPEPAEGPLPERGSSIGERPWHAHYPPGVAADAEMLPFASIGEMARSAAARWGDRTACTMVLPNGWEASLTWREVDRLSEHFAGFLRSRGVGKGDRVALVLPNCLAYPVCSLGVLKAGAVLVNTNPLYTERELEAQLVDSGARLVVVLGNLRDKVERVLPRTSVETLVVTAVGDFFPTAMRLAIAAKLRLARAVPKARAPGVPLARALRLGAAHLSDGPEPAVGRDDVALLQYTGGTTGVSKGAMLTHGNLLANAAQIAQITRGSLEFGRETVLTVLPLYHVFAFTINHLYAFYTGHHSILVPNPRPLRNLRAALRRHEVTWATAVNTLLKGLLAEPWFVSRPPRGLKAVYAGGMEVQPAVFERWERETGSLVIEGFGLTEASPLVTFNPSTRDGKGMRRTLAKVNGVGLPLPGTDLRLMDERGEPVAPGERGEILVKGPQVMLGYWKRPDETSTVLADGWLRTGDVGALDEDGYLRITDRKKDMIVVSGFKVFPNEVEACIAAHPLVAEVAVLGVPDERTGEAVRAFVVPKSAGLTAEDVLVHCRRLLTHYKIPRAVSFVAEVPKSAVGKVLRRELRSQLEAGSA
ncbi:MAG: 1-acylglycerol-3-phosphate O-acyltransferase [Myxococcales bacterium]|jgi:long-chain acyl-CoA synthetase